MNPYDVDYSKFKPSKKITNPRDILKLKLIGHFVDLTINMSTDEIQALTNLDKSDISRLRISQYRRFSTDRLIGILDQLGYTCDLKIKPKKVS